MIDVLVSSLSGGNTVADITNSGNEYAVSQFFICISPESIDERIIDSIINYAKQSEPIDSNSPVRYPGESALRNRERSMREGVYVNEKVWNEVLAL